jgi:hypothetical protein
LIVHGRGSCCRQRQAGDTLRAGQGPRRRHGRCLRHRLDRESP